MNEDNSKWKPEDERFVAFLDILGFKNKVMREPHERIYQELLSISNIKELIEKTYKHQSRNEILIVTFSDSIIVFSKDNSLDTFNQFVFAISYLFSYAINQKIALKGGIAYDKITINKAKQIYFGQPIIDAYYMEEDVNYLGVVAHSSIDKYITNITGNKTFKELLFRCKTNLKSGKITHLNLNWFKIDVKKNENENEKKKDMISMKKLELEEFYSSVSGSPRRYIDNTIDMIDEYQKIK